MTVRMPTSAFFFRCSSSCAVEQAARAQNQLTCSEPTHVLRANTSSRPAVSRGAVDREHSWLGQRVAARHVMHMSDAMPSHSRKPTRRGQLIRSRHLCMRAPGHVPPSHW